MKVRRPVKLVFKSNGCMTKQDTTKTKRNPKSIFVKGIIVVKKTTPKVCAPNAINDLLYLGRKLARTARHRASLPPKICPRCGKNPKERGMLLCPTCQKEAADTRYSRQKASKDKRRLIAIENGMCTHCFKNPATPGYKTCQECRTKINDRLVHSGYMKARRENFIAQGLCGICGKPSRPNRTTCLDCAIRTAKVHKKYYDKVHNKTPKEGDIAWAPPTL